MDEATQAQTAAVLFSTVERGGKITASQERQLLEWITGRTRHDTCNIIDHEDAWDLAHMHADRSNLARCYIDLRKAAQAVLDGDNINGINRLREICRSSGD